jgi:hypothetical protein
LVGLQQLDLPDQGIVDLKPLAHSASLEELNLKNNPVADLSSLLTLPKLRFVDISDTAAAEILDVGDSGMGVRIELEALIDELERRGVDVVNSSATARDDWQLHFDSATLAVIGAEVPDISALGFSELQQLTEFNGDSRRPEVPFLASLEGLQYCGNLQEVKLIEQRIDDLSPLQFLSRLSRLWVIHYDTQEDPFLGQTNHGRLWDLSPLAGHPALEELYLVGTNLLDIEPILDLPMLQTLELNDTFWADLVVFGAEESPAVQAAKQTLFELEASGVVVFYSASNRFDWLRSINQEPVVIEITSQVG